MGRLLVEEDIKQYNLFLSGDVSGFENLVLKYKNQLIYFVMQYVKEFHMAEDMAQDAFVEIYAHKERFNRKQSFKTYLFTIARNKAIDYIRKYNREMPYDINEIMNEEYYELENCVIKKEEQTLVRNTILSLKEDYKLAILLIDFYNMSYEEAAKVLGKTMAQMKILIFRARKSLGKQLLKEGYGYEK